MDKSRFSKAQIVEILEGDFKVPVSDLIRKRGISHATYSNGDRNS